MGKVGRNDKCICGSGKKYKACCLNNVEQKKQQTVGMYQTGHEISSDNVRTIYEFLANEYHDHRIIDISNVLTEDTYRPMQLKNYAANIIMIAERNDTNTDVFAKRSPEDVNMMVLYRGAYQCFRTNDFDVAKPKVTNMIDKRFRGEEM